MSKRRSLAVAMAGAMVATTAVPALAAGFKEFDDIDEVTISAKDDDKLDELYSDLKALLNSLEYDKNDVDGDSLKSDLSEEDVYELLINGNPDLGNNIAALEKAVNKLEKGKKLTVQVKDKGHIKIGGKILSSDPDEVSIYENRDAIISELNDKLDGKLTAEEYGDDAKVIYKQDITATGTNIVSDELQLEMKISAKSPKIDINSVEKEDITVGFATTAEYYKGDADALITVADQALADKINATIPQNLKSLVNVTFSNGKLLLNINKQNGISVKPIELSVDSTDGLKVIDFSKPVEEEMIVSFGTESGRVKSKLSEKITITASDESVIKMDTLYDGIMLTLDGKKLTDFVKDGKESGDYTYFVEMDSNEEPILYLNKDDKEIVINIMKAKTDDYEDRTDENVSGAKLYKSISIDGNDIGELRDLQAILKGGNQRAELVAGDSRYETAIEIAKKGVEASYDTDGAFDPDGMYSGESIVLVNSSSMVDGLTAGPLAAAKKAPILLTEKGELTEATYDYIKDFADDMGKDEDDITVYIVGGEAVVSEKVVKDLKKIGVDVKRVDGDDRQETSLEVAKEIDKDANSGVNKVFVVGANGEADAMSISPVASIVDSNKEVSPIIVAGLDKMSKYSLDFIEDAEVEVDIIGGKTAVSDDMEKAIEKVADGEDVNRVSGSDRFETNKNVINEYYASGDTKVFAVAKDSYNGKNNEALVDALAAGPFLAAQNKGAFLVLATEKDKVEGRISQVIDNKLVDDADKASTGTKLYQFGAGVKSAVIEILADKIGLEK